MTTFWLANLLQTLFIVAVAFFVIIAIIVIYQLFRVFHRLNSKL